MSSATLQRSPTPTLGAALWRRMVLCLCLGVLFGPAAECQFAQDLSDEEPGVRRDSIRIELRQALRNAHWKLGRAYFSPWLALRDVTTVDNLGARPDELKRGDSSVSIGAGLRGYLPVGRRLTLAGHALPEYIWFAESAGRRRLEGRYGIGLFGGVGPLDLEVSFRHQEASRVFSRELVQRIPARTQRAEVRLLARFNGALGLFGDVSETRRRFVVDPDSDLPLVEVLDRDELVLRAGFRLFLPRGTTVSAGIEHEDVDFREFLDLRSTEGTSPFVEVRYSGPRVFVDFEAVARERRPQPGLESIAYERVDGRFRCGWKPAVWLRFQIHGSQDLVYSFQSRWAYFEDRVGGFSVRTGLGPRASLRAIFERGRNDYVSFFPEVFERRDDFDSLAGELLFKLGKTTLFVRGSRTEFESTLPDLGRTVTILGAGFFWGKREISEWG